MKSQPDELRDRADMILQLTSSSVPSTVTPSNGGTSRSKTLRHSYQRTLPRRPPVDIEFINLNYTINQKTILKNICGKFNSGELTAIMGPSGAGKSTFMNILAGYTRRHVSGTVLINGKPRNPTDFRRNACYIMQDDCLLQELTVKETMNISANLKLGKDIPSTGKHLIVNEVLDSLGLNGVRNIKVCRLSGGQRKRLAIALELVHNPPVMFLDEPTSGLDSLSCFQCISLLKSLAHGDRTIICTIHQPSSRIFEIFDHLYTIANGGCVYRGSVVALVPYLKSIGLQCPRFYNPADFIIEIASGDYGHEWIQNLTNMMKTKGSEVSEYLLDEDHNEKSIEIHIDPTAHILFSPKQSIEGYPVTFFRQFLILFKRTFISTARDKTLTFLRLLGHLFMGLIIGAIYYGIGNDAEKTMSNMGCLFFITMFNMFSSMMPTILTFPLELRVFLREYLNYWYSPKAYYMAKTVADIPFQTIFTMIFVTLVYFMSGQPYDVNRYFMTCNINILISLVAQSTGLLCGVALNVQNATFIGPISSIPIMLFGGFFVNFSILSKWLSWLPYISYLKYGFEGTLVAIYGNNRPMLDCKAKYCLFQLPKEILKERDMENANYWMNWLALLGFFLGFRILVFLMLKLKILHSLR